jgi:hypothetical protein
MAPGAGRPKRGVPQGRLQPLDLASVTDLSAHYGTAAGCISPSSSAVCILVAAVLFPAAEKLGVVLEVPQSVPAPFCANPIPAAVGRSPRATRRCPPGYSAPSSFAVHEKLRRLAQLERFWSSWRLRVRAAGLAVPITRTIKSTAAGEATLNMPTPENPKRSSRVVRRLN